MSDIKTIFVVLKLLEIILIFVTSFWVSKAVSNKKYWKRALIPIVIFSLIEGLRFGRMQDYNGYYLRYNILGSGSNTDGYEFLFAKICYYFNMLDLHYWVFIFCCSAFLIYAFMFLFRNYRQALPFIFLCLFWEIRESENLIRYFLAMSFYLIAISNRINDKKILSYLSWFCAVNIHSGYWVVLPVLLFYDFINKPLLTPKISAMIFVILTFTATIGMMTFLSNWVSFFDFLGNDKVSLYTDRADEVLSGNFGYNAGSQIGRSITNNVRLLLAYLPPILWGRDILEKRRGGLFCYNMFVFGAIIFTVCGMIEILDRLIFLFTIFSCIVSGFLFYSTVFKKQQVRKYIYFFTCLSLLASTWPAVSVVFNRAKDDYMLFIWDAKGRNYMPRNTIPMFK